ALWQDLVSEDAKRAFAAMARMARSPKERVAWLRRRVPPATKDDVAILQGLVADLDSNKFAAREHAPKALEERCDLAAALLDKPGRTDGGASADGQRRRRGAGAARRVGPGRPRGVADARSAGGAAKAN